MGKDKRKITFPCMDLQVFYKEIEEHSKNDINDILQYGGLQTDLYKECWLAGFRYAERRIANILEMSEKIK